jgi:hypothetical protein
MAEREPRKQPNDPREFPGEVAPEEADNAERILEVGEDNLSDVERIALGIDPLETETPITVDDEPPPEPEPEDTEPA